jgi:hypothetical protein
MMANAQVQPELGSSPIKLKNSWKMYRSQDITHLKGVRMVSMKPMVLVYSLY